MTLSSVHSTGERGDWRGARLSDLSTGDAARVVAIDGDRAIVRRFRSMGLRAGGDVTVSYRRGRSVVVACGGGRLALGREMARRVLVERAVR